MYSFIHLFICSFVHLFIHYFFIDSVIDLFIYSVIQLFSYSFIHLFDFIYLCVYLFFNLSLWSHDFNSFMYMSLERLVQPAFATSDVMVLADSPEASALVPSSRDILAPQEDTKSKINWTQLLSDLSES